MEIRTPTAEEGAAIGELAALSFNVSPAAIREHAPYFRPEPYLCAYEGDRLIATTRDIPMQQWFGGRPLPIAGVASVATIPEVRGTGVGDVLMRALLQRARERGAIVTTLYPATVPFYRRLGYEYGGTWTMFRASLAALPRASGETAIELFEGDDVSEIRSCYRAFAEGRTGPIEGEDESWWRDRVLNRRVTDAVTRGVVARGPAGIEGYATFALRTQGPSEGYDVQCTHLVGTTSRALGDLLGYFRRFKGVGRGLVWHGPPHEPLALLFDEQTARVKDQFRYMTRLLDVPAALEARGYPEGVTGSAVLEVDDPVFEDNRGAFRITADDGKVRVERAEESGALRISIGALSALFCGYLSPLELAGAGAIENRHPSAEFLTTLFAGPPPFMFDFF